MHVPGFPRRIAYGSPVNWQSPLTRGLVGWWMVLPKRAGGARLLNLAGRQHGVLTNMAPSAATSGWGATARHGGYGELRVALAQDGHVRFTPELNLGASTAMMFWFKSPSYAPAGQVLFGSSVSANCFINALTPGSSFIVRDSTATLLTFIIPTLVAESWYHLVVSRDADGTTHLYINGLESSSGGQALAAGNAFPLDLFGAYNAANNGLLGALDDLMVFAQAIGTPQLRAIYQDSRTFHPHMLRRVGGVVMEGAAAAGTALPEAWMQYRSRRVA